MPEGNAGGATTGSAGTTAPVTGGSTSAPGTSQTSATITPTPNQASGAPKTWDVKIDGQVVKMTEAELLSNASLGKAAFKRMEEGTLAKRQAEAFITKFRQDPMAALDDPALGLTDSQKREAIESYYKKNYIEQDKLTPAEKELQRANAEIKKYKDKEIAEGKAKEAQQAQELMQQWRGNYEKQIIETLDKSGLPKTPHTVARMAFYMQQAARAKADVPMDTIAAQVRKDYQEAFQALTSSAAPEALVQFLGPDAAKKIQKYAVLQHKKKLAEGFEPKEAPVTEVKPKKKSEQNTEGWKKVTNYWTRNDQ